MTWILANLPLLGERTLAHVAIALPAIVLSFVLSLPLGWAANRFRPARGILLTITGLLYAIPSLPLFIVLPVIIGTGLRNPVNLVIALTLYGIALMVRFFSDGLASVDPAISQSATAMGYSAGTKFWRVELPLAGPVLLAGIRVVSVSTISLTTVGGVLGINNLGLLFVDGIQRNIPEEILAGLALVIILSVLFDLALVALGRVLLPWAGATTSRRARRSTTEAVA